MLAMALTLLCLADTGPSLRPSFMVSRHLQAMWEFPKIRGTILGVPIISIIVFWGLYWGPPILGNYHV